MKKLFFLLCLLPFSVVAQKLWTLSDCIQYAKENNLSIKQSEIDLKATDIDKMQAKAGFLPSVNGNASYNLNEGKNINPVTNQFENAFFQSASGGVSVDLTLFAGLQNWRKLHQAELNRIASQYQLDKMKDDIVLMIINAYAEVLSNKEQIKNLKAQLEISKESLTRTRELIGAGSLPKGDIYEAEAQPSTDILNKTPEEIYERAKEVMSDVKLAEANMQVAQNSLRLSQSAYSPRLSAQWGYSSRWSKNQAQDFWQQLDANKGMYAGLSLNIPIFNGFSTLGTVKRQRLNFLKSQFAKEQAELTSEKNIYQAYNDASNAKKLYEASEKTVQAKQQAFSYAQERHNVGLMNTFDFSQAKYQYENAQNDFVKAKYQYIFKLKVLEYYFSH